MIATESLRLHTFSLRKSERRRKTKMAAALFSIRQESAAVLAHSFDPGGGLRPRLESGNTRRGYRSDWRATARVRGLAGRQAHASLLQLRHYHVRTFRLACRVLVAGLGAFLNTLTR